VQNGRYRGACKINPGGEHPFPYMVSVAADSGMIEWPFLEMFKEDKRKLIERYRLLMGQKYIGQHAGWGEDKYGETLGYEKYPPEQLQLLYRARVEYDVLAFLLYGIHPFPALFTGVPEIFNMLDWFEDMTSLGWYASPGVRTPDKILTSRYGQDLRAAVVFANPGTQTLEGNSVIYGDDFAGGAPLPFDYKENKLKIDIKRNESSIPLNLKPRAFLATALLGGYYGSQTFSCESKQFRSSHEIRLELNFSKGNKTIEGKWRFPLLPNYQKPIVTLTGKVIKFEQDDKGITFQTPIQAGGTLKLQYFSPVFLSPDSELTEFPAVEKCRAASQIILPKANGRLAELAAFWIQEFFNFYFLNAVSTPVELKLPILKAEEINRKFPASFKLEIGKNMVKIDGNTLLISGSDERKLAELTWDTLKIFEKKYPFYDTFHASGSSFFKYNCKPETRKLLEKANLWNRHLRLYQGMELPDILKKNNINSSGKENKESCNDVIYRQNFDNIGDLAALNGYGGKNSEIEIDGREKFDSASSCRMFFSCTLGINSVGKLVLKLPEPLDLSNCNMSFMFMPLNANCGIHGLELIDNNGKIVEESRYYAAPPLRKWSKRFFKQGEVPRKNSGKWFRNSSEGNIHQISEIRILIQSSQKEGDVEALIDEFLIEKQKTKN
jgi:hypothetical protein